MKPAVSELSLGTSPGERSDHGDRACAGRGVTRNGNVHRHCIRGNVPRVRHSDVSTKADRRRRAEIRVAVARHNDAHHGRPDRPGARGHAGHGGRWVFARALTAKRDDCRAGTRVVEGAKPVRGPTAVGVNVIDTAQLLNAGIVPPHASTAAKSPAMSVPSAAGTAWWFVSSTCCGPLVVFTSCGANVNNVTEAVTPLMPLPLSATAFGDSVVSLVMTSNPVRRPATVGVIVREITQLCVAASVGPHVVPTTSTAKLPVTDSDMALTATLWLFRTVTCCVVLASPTFVLPNETLVGVIVRGSRSDAGQRCEMRTAEGVRVDARRGRPRTTDRRGERHRDAAACAPRACCRTWLTDGIIRARDACEAREWRAKGQCCRLMVGDRQHLRSAGRGDGHAVEVQRHRGDRHRADSGTRQ